MRGRGSERSQSRSLLKRCAASAVARAVSSGMALVGLVRTCNGRGRAIIQLVRDETASSLPAVTFSVVRANGQAIT